MATRESPNGNVAYAPPKFGTYTFDEEYDDDDDDVFGPNANTNSNARGPLPRFSPGRSHGTAGDDGFDCTRSPRAWRTSTSALTDSCSYSECVETDLSVRRQDRELKALGTWLNEFQGRIQSKLRDAEVFHQRRMDDHSRELDMREEARKAVLLAEAKAAERARREEEERAAAEAAAQAAAETQAARDESCAHLTAAERAVYEADQAELAALEARLNRHTERLGKYAEYAEEEYGKYLASEAEKTRKDAEAAAEIKSIELLNAAAAQWPLQILEHEALAHALSLEKEESLRRVPLRFAYVADHAAAVNRGRQRVYDGLDAATRRAVDRQSLEEEDEAEGERKRLALLDDLLETEALKRRLAGRSDRTRAELHKRPDAVESSTSA
jgi:hypothetical protein